MSAPRSTDRDVNNLLTFGKNVGVAFQLVDDLIGVVGDPNITGKAVGNDIREGKKTYPILLALKKARGQSKEKILKVFGSKKTSSMDLKEAVKIISEIGIDVEIRKAAKEHIRRAIKSIEFYKESDAKRALEASANFIVERSL